VVAVSFFVAGKMGVVFPPNTALLVTVFVTTFAWIGTTLATRPENEETLVGFYRLIRPAGPGWKPIAAKATEAAGAPFEGGRSPDSISLQLLGWVLGCAFVYATLFGAGSALYGRTPQVIVWAFVWVASGAGLLRIVSRLWH
jgi:hypothetical protein